MKIEFNGMDLDAAIQNWENETKKFVALSVAFVFVIFFALLYGVRITGFVEQLMLWLAFILSLAVLLWIGDRKDKKLKKAKNAKK